MSLHDTMNRLERRWTLDARRNPPWPRWSAHSPALALDPIELRSRLVSRDRARSGPVLAALVELAARHDDRQAAELVTIALLPRMVAAEQRGIRDTYEQMAGLLWEAIVTAPNPHATCLRESIERNVWRRKRLTDRSIRAISLDANGVDLDRTSVLRRPGDDDPTPDEAHDRHVLNRLHALGRDRAITPTTHRILLHIAHGTDAAAPGQSAATARKQRLRTLAGLKRSPAVCEALIA